MRAGRLAVTSELAWPLAVFDLTRAHRLPCNRPTAMGGSQRAGEPIAVHTHRRQILPEDRRTPSIPSAAWL